jgi:excisionase family DNA binding protein
LDKLQELIESNYKIQIELLQLFAKYLKDERHLQKEPASQSTVLPYRIDLPHVLTVQEVASFLKINTNRVYCLCRSKDFPCIQLGKRLIIPRDQFLEWVRMSAEKGSIY